MGKIDENKKKKKEALFNTAYELFTTKGITSTTISDIVEKPRLRRALSICILQINMILKINWSFIKRRSFLMPQELHLRKNRFTDLRIK